jgi:hypothetical protein
MSKPKTPKVPPVVPAATRSDASVITAGGNEPQLGFSVITNSQTGKLQRRAQTGKTVTTGGGQGANN